MNVGKDCPQWASVRPPAISPAAGEIWFISYFQTCVAGRELYGKRPHVVLNDPHNHPFQLQLVIPLTGTKPTDRHHFLAAVLDPSKRNNLGKASTAWAFQARSCDLCRFDGASGAIGSVEASELEDIRQRVALFLGIT